MSSKDYSFTIKVWDILHNLWTKDTIVFSNKFSTLLPQVKENWLSCKIQLQALSDEQLLVSIPKIIVPMSIDCDFCGKGFEKVYYIKRLTTKAVKSSLLDLEKGYEIHIDDKNRTIDIEKRLVESIFIELPVNNLCESCLKKSNEESSEDTNITNIVWK